MDAMMLGAAMVACLSATGFIANEASQGAMAEGMGLGHHHAFGGGPGHADCHAGNMTGAGPHGHDGMQGHGAGGDDHGAACAAGAGAP